MKKLNAGLLSLLTLAMLVGCGGHSETEPKTDDLKTGNMISISAKNSFEGEVKIINGLPQTTKNDSTHHGFGLKSIKMICEKYPDLSKENRCIEHLFYYSNSSPIGSTME